jgi:hypothetical protein
MEQFPLEVLFYCGRMKSRELTNSYLLSLVRRVAPLPGIIACSIQALHAQPHM